MPMPVVRISLLALVILTTGNAFANNIPVEELAAQCREAAARATKQITDVSEDVQGPLAFSAGDGGLGLSWYRNSPDDDVEVELAKDLSRNCEKLSIIEIDGGTGGQLRWYIKRDGFSVTHSRDSGLPGDFDRYWHQDEVPFDYDPARDYVPQ